MRFQRESGPSCDETTNIMYPSGGAARSLLTAGQGKIMRRHPLCRLESTGAMDPDMNKYELEHVVNGPSQDDKTGMAERLSNRLGHLLHR